MIEKNLLNARIQLKNNILNESKDVVGCVNEKKQIYDLLKRTVDFGESNSALLIGPKGSGKTALVNEVVRDLKTDTSFNSNCVLVRLNGVLHTDDRLALLSTTSQMQLDNAVDGKVFGSFAENLAFLLACLRTGNKSSSKSVLFLIDEFDLFCNHHNQTLLYNLFDISQSAQAPVCVLGITCRLDVIEMLEKRVKSRFSHRQYFLFPGQEGETESDKLQRRMGRIRDLLTITKRKNLSADFVKKWNTHIDVLANDKKVGMYMQRMLDLDLSETRLKNMLIVMVSKLGADYDFLSTGCFEDAMNEVERDDVVEQLQDLSVLELCLLISMKHHAQIYDDQPMNFEMVFTRYVKFANSSSNIQTVQRPVVMKAFEHIQSMELVQNVAGATGRLQKEYTMFKLVVTSQQITDAIKKWQSLPTDVAQWAISSIL